MIKRISLSFLLSVGFLFQIGAQDSGSNLSNLLAEGYTIDELKDIYTSITYDNYKKWLKKKGFEYVQEFESGLTEYKKNDVVSLGLFVKKNTSSISEIFFHSSPQKFYQAVSKLEDDKTFTKLADKSKSSKKWYKAGYIYYTNDEYFNVGIYRDINNEASTSRLNSNTGQTSGVSSSTSTTTKTTSSSTSSYVPAKFDMSTAQKFADILNANMSRAHIGATGYFSVYDFRWLGKMDLAKRSIIFVEKEGELYVKMNIPMNGDCDYGLKMVKAKFLNYCTIGMNELCVKLAMEYECNGNKYKELLVAVPRTGTDYAKEDLYHAIVARFKECCK